MPLTIVENPRHERTLKGVSEMEQFRAVLGGFPGANGNPMIGLVWVLSTIAGFGLIKYTFFSVKRNERGVWLRLGNVVYRRKWVFGLIGPKVEPRLLVPGRPGIRFPFIWRLVKTEVSIRMNRIDNVEVERADPMYPGHRQYWKFSVNAYWKVQTSPHRVVRASLLAQDLEQNVVGAIESAIRICMRTYPVGKLENDLDLKRAVKAICKAELAGYGIGLTKLHLRDLSAKDTVILGNMLGETDITKSTKIAAIDRSTGVA